LSSPSCGASILGTQSQQCQRHVPCSTADVQDCCFRAGEDALKSTRRTSPPEAVNLAGKNMVQQVIAGSNVIKHPAYRMCGAGGVCAARGLCSVCGHYAFRAWLSIHCDAEKSSASVTSSMTCESPMPTGKINRRTPRRFFLSRPVASTSFCALVRKGGSGP